MKEKLHDFLISREGTDAIRIIFIKKFLNGIRYEYNQYESIMTHGGYGRY